MKIQTYRIKLTELYHDWLVTNCIEVESDKIILYNSNNTVWITEINHKYILWSYDYRFENMASFVQYCEKYIGQYE